MNSIPESLDDITESWLQDALADRFPGVVVAGVDIERSHEVTNYHAHLQVNYSQDAGAPSRFFCKLLPCTPERHDLIANTGMGLREARFYSELEQTLDMRTPDVYCARYDSNSGAFVLLMEHIISNGCTVSDGTQTVTIDSAAGAIEDLATMHMRYASENTRQAAVPWLLDGSIPSPGNANYGPSMLQYGLDNHRDKLSNSFATVSEIYIRQHEALHDLWQQGPQTLVHGDTHIGNLFDDHGRTGFLDWGLLGISTPLRDLSYFLIMSLSTEDRRQHERDLIHHYLDILKTTNAFNINFDEAWKTHRLQAAYGVPASCQIVLFPEDATDRRNKFANAFLARASAALDDLEVIDALKQHAGITA